MALGLLNTVDIIEVMENYLARVRPPQHIQDRLDISYKIENQSIILYEKRPTFQNPTERTETEYAKATYVKSDGKWKVYWIRGNLKWSLYEPNSKVSSLKEFLTIVDEDKYHCFKG
ncbi:MAG: DUF3024 domain-containing protein [Flavitalea sp.]